MLVKDCMTRHPIMISPDTLAAEAQKIMTENGVRHLPVVADGKRLVGLVTRDSFSLSPDTLGSLDVWEISRRLSNLQVKSVMKKASTIQTISPDRTVERAARMLNETKASGMPVIEDDVVVGILTETDIMAALQDMLGLPVDGVRVTVRMPNRPGEFSKLMTVLGEQDWGVTGIGTYRATRADGDMYDAVIKLVGRTIISTDRVKKILNGIEDQEVVDIRDVV